MQMALRSPEHGSGRSVLSVSSLAPWKVSVSGVLNPPRSQQLYLRSSLPQTCLLPSAPPPGPRPPPDVSCVCPTLRPHTFPRHTSVPLGMLVPALRAFLWFCSLFSRCSHVHSGLTQALLHLTHPSPKHTPVCQEPACLLHVLPVLTCSQLSPLRLVRPCCIHLHWSHTRQGNSTHLPSQTGSPVLCHPVPGVYAYVL